MYSRPAAAQRGRLGAARRAALARRVCCCVYSVVLVLTVGAFAARIVYKQ